MPGALDILSRVVVAVHLLQEPSACQTSLKRPAICLDKLVQDRVGFACRLRLAAEECGELFVRLDLLRRPLDRLTVPLDCVGQELLLIAFAVLLMSLVPLAK